MRREKRERAFGERFRSSTPPPNRRMLFCYAFPFDSSPCSCSFDHQNYLSVSNLSSSISLRGQTSIENQKESQKRPRKQCSLSPSSRSIDRRGTALEFSTRRGTARARNFKSARSRYRADARASARTTGGVVGIEAIFCFRFSSSHSINWRNQAKKSEEEKKLFSCFSSTSTSVSLLRLSSPLLSSIPSPRRWFPFFN